MIVALQHQATTLVIQHWLENIGINPSVISNTMRKII